MENGADKSTLEGRLGAVERLIAFLLALDPQKEAIIREKFESGEFTFYEPGCPSGETPDDEIVRGEMSAAFQRVLSYSETLRKSKMLQGAAARHREGTP